MTLDVVIRGAAVLIEFGGSVVIAVAVVRGLAGITAGLGSRHAVVRGRLLVADGVVAALGYKTATTLLKTIELQSWTAIGMFAAIDPPPLKWSALRYGFRALEDGQYGKAA